MKVIDLTQTIDKDMPLYSGTPQPDFSPSANLYQDGFRETLLSMVSHTGTHIDAPAHMFEEGITLEQISVDKFVGMGVIVNATGCDREIPLSVIEPYGGKMRFCQFVILKTGRDSLWGQQEYFSDYPILSAEAAEFLAKQEQLIGIGIDAISFDKEEDVSFPVHKTLLRQGKILIENLTNLNEVFGNIAMFSFLPLKYHDAEGSPVRAVAFQPPPGLFCPC